MKPRTLAIASVVCATFALVILVIPFLGVYTSGVLGPASVALGAVAVSRTKDGGPNLLGGLLLGLVSGIPAGAVVQIKDADGNVHTFDGPDCKGWKLAAGSTCTDIVAATKLGGGSTGGSIGAAAAAASTGSGGGGIIVGHDDLPFLAPRDNSDSSTVPKNDVPPVTGGSEGGSIVGHDDQPFIIVGHEDVPYIVGHDDQPYMVAGGEAGGAGGGISASR